VRWRSLLLRGIALVLALVVAIPVAVAGRVWYVARQDDRAPSDVILVLGTTQYDGRPSSIFIARLEHALVLHESGVAPVVMTVGGSRPGDRFTEARAAADYLIAGGLSTGEIMAVGEGSDTLRSIQAAARVMARHDWSSAVLVTDPWHMLRARSMARDAGIEAVGSPTRQGPAVYSRQTQLRYIARETAALLSYEVFGRSVGVGSTSSPNVGTESAVNRGDLTQSSWSPRP
jgi:uncharacterized SAM-binding protein YcdF (DUF218 family)